jgi:hypothetical protein
MHKSTILVLILLLTTLFFIGSYTPSTQADSTAPNLYIDPLSTTINVTETFSVNVTVANITDLAGWEFKLYYYNDILNGVTATEGPFLKQGGSTAFFVVDFNNHYNSTHGRIWLTCTLLGNVSGVNGSGTLAIITFQGVGGGNTTLDLTNTVLGDSQANPISHTTSDGEVRVIGLSDIAVTNVIPLKTIVGQGYNMHINVTMANQGDLTETFNVTIYANTTAVNQTEVTLTSGVSTTVTLTWNTTGFIKGNYSISAYATPVHGETDTTDNTFVYGSITVTIPGDVDGDFDVDIYDVVKIAGIYGSVKGDPEFNPNCDLDDDGEITIYDVVRCTSHYGDTGL